MNHELQRISKPELLIWVILKPKLQAYLGMSVVVPEKTLFSVSLPGRKWFSVFRLSMSHLQHHICSVTNKNNKKNFMLSCYQEQSDDLTSLIFTLLGMCQKHKPNCTSGNIRMLSVVSEFCSRGLWKVRKALFLSAAVPVILIIASNVRTCLNEQPTLCSAAGDSLTVRSNRSWDQVALFGTSHGEASRKEMREGDVGKERGANCLQCLKI